MTATKDRVGRRGPGWHVTFTISVYRRTGGRLLGQADGLPVLLLTTTGRRTGRPRTVPVAYALDGGRYLVAGRT